jgi:hypothetical protein
MRAFRSVLWGAITRPALKVDELIGRMEGEEE